MILYNQYYWYLSILLSVILIPSCREPSIFNSNSSYPNIVIILSDDMGFSDIGCYGSEIRTPNLDQLAYNGIRYSQFYNSARCCPSRASLLTGLYPHQAGIGHMMEQGNTPGYKGDLNREAVTIAEYLKEAGYENYLSGKWHVTPYVITDPNKDNWPLQRGFDKFYGLISGAGSYYDPRSLTLDNEYVPPPEDFYSTTHFTNHAIQCLEEHDKDKPFFLYLSYMSAHWPMHAPDSSIQKYKGLYDRGWKVMREERFNRSKELGVISASCQLSPLDGQIPNWNDEVENREWELKNMETYGAIVEIMDQQIGRVLEKLKEMGAYENTLVLYLQDNGGCAEDLSWVSPQPPVEEILSISPEDLQTRMIPDITRDGQVVKLMKDGVPGPPDGYTAYGVNWANVSNTPFREYKHWVNEGGIASPLIAHWPKGILNPGRIDHRVGHLIDIMPTLVDLVGTEFPKSFASTSTLPLEGASLVSSFHDLEEERDAIFWEHEGNRAVRKGNWKLVSSANPQNAYAWNDQEQLPMEEWELYDMESDRSETLDISSEYPELVRELATMWQEWAYRARVFPKPQ